MLLVGPNIFIDYSVCLIFDFKWTPNSEKIEISSLAPEYVINPGELRFPIRLPADWQSLIGPLCSNQAERLHLRHNSCFIFLFGILLHWCYRVGDVFNIKISLYDFIFYLIHASISSVGSWDFSKNTSHLVLIGHEFHPLVQELIWCIFYKLKTSELFWCDEKSIWHVLLILTNPHLSYMMWI
jgi:hypothetical protein